MAQAMLLQENAQQLETTVGLYAHAWKNLNESAPRTAITAASRPPAMASRRSRLRCVRPRLANRAVNPHVRDLPCFLPTRPIRRVSFGGSRRRGATAARRRPDASASVSPPPPWRSATVVLPRCRAHSQRLALRPGGSLRRNRDTGRRETTLAAFDADPL